MPQIPQTVQFQSAWTLVRFAMMLNKIWVQLASVINNHISFGNPTSGADNIDGKWLSFATPAGPNTDFTLTHNLGRVPVGYLVMSKSAACDLYTGSVAATATQITLRATVGAVNMVIFVL